MSIARACIRMAATFALTGKTMAEERVADSSIVDIGEFIADAPAPVLLVYTDDSETVPEGRELWGGQGSVTMVLILAVAGRTTMTDDTYEFSFPATDKATEMSLDIMERQIQRTLMDPLNPWSAIWRGLVAKVTKWKSQRGATTKEGVRYGARQIIVEMETMHDPIPGGEAGPAWQAFLAQLLVSGADLAALEPPMRKLIEGDPLPSWTRTMSEFGFDRQTLRGIGVEPFLFHTATALDEPAELDEIQVDGMDQTTTIEGEAP